MKPQDQIKELRIRADQVRADIYQFLENHTGKGKYNPDNSAAIDSLHRAQHAAADCRGELLDAAKDWVE